MSCLHHDSEHVCTQLFYVNVRKISGAIICDPNPVVRSEEGHAKYGLDRGARILEIDYLSGHKPAIVHRRRIWTGRAEAKTKVGR